MTHVVSASDIDAGKAIMKAKLANMKKNWDDAKTEMKAAFKDKVPKMVENYGKAFPNATIAKEVYGIKAKNMSDHFNSGIDNAKYEITDAQLDRYARKTKRGLGL